MTSSSFPADDQLVENVKEYVYLGHIINLGKENQTAEVTRRVKLTWAAFGKLKHIFGKFH